MDISSSGEILERLLRSRIQLALQQPFLASALMRLPFRPCPGRGWCPTMATDGYHVFFNPEWVASLRDAEVRGVLAHEVMHVVFAHADRAGERLPRPWNLACDHAINLILCEQGFRLPSGGVMDPRFAGMTAEQIYERIATEPSTSSVPLMTSSTGRNPSGDDVNLAGVLANPGADLLQPSDPRVVPLRDPDMPDAEQLAELVAMLRQDAASRLHGRAAAYFQQECEAARQSRVDWVALLRQWLHDRLRSDWSSIPFSKRHLHRGIYLPSPGVRCPDHLVFAIDTSGSMSDVQLAQILREVQAFRECFPSQLTVIQADATVQSVRNFAAMDGSEVPQRMTMLGRGGTDFRPVFEWVQGNVQEASPILLYATDGYGVFPECPPGWPTIWLLTQEGIADGQVPFGTCARLP